MTHGYSLVREKSELVDDQGVQEEENEVRLGYCVCVHAGSVGKSQGCRGGNHGRGDSESGEKQGIYLRQVFVTVVFFCLGYRTQFDRTKN